MSSETVQRPSASAVVKLNVGGTTFQTTWKTLRSVPGTRLSELGHDSPEWLADSEEFFFDRDPCVFGHILGLCRTGELHLPGYVCGPVLQRELDFWKIPETLVSDCCWKNLYKEKQVRKMKEEMTAIFADRSPYYFQRLKSEFKCCKLANLRWKLWALLEKPDYSRLSLFWFHFYMALVVLSTVALFLQTLPAMRDALPLASLEASGEYDNVTGQWFLPYQRHEPVDNPKLILLMKTRPTKWLVVVGIVCLVVFTADFFLRFLVSREKDVFARQVLNWLDLVVIAAEWLGFLFMHQDTVMLAVVGEACRLLSYFRFFRFYRLAWRSDEVRLLKLCLLDCRKEFLMLIVLVVITSAGFAIFIYVVEIFEPLTFRNLLVALWWAVITLTSVGYGDVVPTSHQGRLVSGACAVAGMLVVALPIAVIATNFGDYHSLYREMRALMDRKKSVASRQKEGKSNQVAPTDDVANEIQMTKF